MCMHALYKGDTADDYERWLEETVLKIDEGIESLERGEGDEVEIVFNRLREKLRQAKAYQ